MKGPDFSAWKYNPVTGMPALKYVVLKKYTWKLMHKNCSTHFFQSVLVV